MSCGCRALLAGLALPTAACIPAPPAPPPQQIVWFIADGLRQDALGCMGAPDDPSPAIDELARVGTRFEHVVAASSQDVPALASLLTGTLPRVHGARTWGDASAPLAEHVPTLAQVLAASGMRRMAVSSGPFSDPRLGFARGFERYEHSPTPWTADETAERALALLSEQRDAPFLLVVHFVDLHAPWTPDADRAQLFRRDKQRAALAVTLADCIAGEVDAQRLAEVRRAYQASVRCVDDAIHRVLEALRHYDRYEDALIVVSASHAERLGEKAAFGHSAQLTTAALTVPLVLAQPRLRPQRAHVPEPVRVIDIAPTVVDWFDRAGSLYFEGHSLAALTRGEPTSGVRTALSEADAAGGPSTRFADHRFVYRRSTVEGEVREELYDRISDPEERTDVRERYPQDFMRARAEHARLLERYERAARPSAPAQRIATPTGGCGAQRTP